MTPLEILVIFTGLVVGWVVVSKLMGGSGGNQQILDDPKATWSDILGVSNEADTATIRSAYESKLAELDSERTAIMTRPETEAHTKARQRVEAAYQEGVAGKA
jgi:preprotein translocase subunit Sec63